MIEFQDILEETQTLKDQIAEQMKLIRALANFHVDKQLHRNADELHNQRTQLMQAIKELEHKLARLTDSQEQLNSNSNTKLLTTRRTGDIRMWSTSSSNWLSRPKCSRSGSPIRSPVPFWFYLRMAISSPVP